MSAKTRPVTRCAAVIVVAYLGVGLGAASAAAAGGEPQLASEPAVKLSRSGICHDRTSPNYRRLKTYDPYASIEECLAAIVAWPLLSLWFARRRMRSAFRGAEDRARRQWEGHRLDRRGPDRKY